MLKRIYTSTPKRKAVHVSEKLSAPFTYQNARYTIACDKNGRPSIGTTIIRFKNNLTGGHIVEQFPIIEGMRMGLSTVELEGIRRSL